MSRDEAGLSRDGVPCPGATHSLKSNCLCADKAITEGAGQPGHTGTVPGPPAHAHRDEKRDSGTSPYRGVLCPDVRCIAGPSYRGPFGGTRSRINSIYGNDFRAIAR